MRKIVGRDLPFEHEDLSVPEALADAFVVVASYAGEPRDPEWWRNLKAHPAAEVMVDGRSLEVRAREADGARRELLWSRIVEADPAYAEYQRRTERRLPVVLLEPL